jgi:hypothetical protein
MDGTIFREILIALQTEGVLNATIASWATTLNNNMQSRAVSWSQLVFPYGSEFAYDTTGQEEVYIWLQHFGYIPAANNTLNSILAYMRLLPNWVYHGGATSQGDLGNNGKWFFTDYVNQASKKIFFVDYENQADLKIFFVSNENQAGWKNSGKKQLMY